MKTCKKVSLFIAAMFLFFVVYFLVKMIAPVGVPVEIFIDAYIPFVPIFVVPYVLFWPFVLIPWVLLWKNNKEYKALALSFIIGLIICELIFIAWQTSGPRMDLEVVDSFTWLISQIYGNDTNLNAFPSIHALLSVLTGGFLWVNYKRKWIGYGAVALAVLIVMSTVLIKQHGIIDVIGGIVVAFLSYKVARRMK